MKEPARATSRRARILVLRKARRWRASPRPLLQFAARIAADLRLSGEIAIVLGTDAQIRALNRRFRGRDYATDVLSFPAAGGGEGGGDIVISMRAAARQAGEFGHPLATDLRILVLHGLLHLAGYDHETDRGRMRRREEQLRRRWGLPSGLIRRARGA